MYPVGFGPAVGNSVFSTGSTAYHCEFPQGCSFHILSDNGLWATAAGVNDDDQSKYAYPYLINVETGALTELWVEADLIKSLEATGVTNDGKSSLVPMTASLLIMT